MEIAVSILILMVALIIGMPIPYAFGASFIWIAYSLDFQTDFLLAAGYSQLNSVVLLAIPLFVLAGGIMEKGQIGESLVGLVERFVGRFKGGLAAVAVVASAIFGSISG
ncbi:MAG: TRAP transporter large permease subunit, partial [Candidatus Merdivicinus sp.]